MTCTRIIGLRADMDALPIVEATGLPYASTTEGRMHACGHDGHTTILIGAARVLAALAGEMKLPRPVTFCFQPAEEGGAGGKRMVEDGCLTGKVIGPPIGEMFGLHGWPQLPLGLVGTRPGPLLAAADMFEITLRGDGCHAAFPHVGRDPIVAASSLVSALQTIPSRNADPLDAVVVSVTQVHSGFAHNVIPDSAVIGGTVRTLKAETQQMAIRRMREIAEGVAAAHGCSAALDYQVGYPVTLNDETAVATFNDVARSAIGGNRVIEVPQPFMGGEDFSFYCHEVPACFFILGLRPEGVDAMPDLHQPTFNFNDDAIATGVELFCRLALRA
jgi:hippurate hydrolase